MNRTEKQQEMGSLKERLEQSKIFLFAGYRGLKVSQISELRSELNRKQSKLKVIKNRLAKRVFDEKGLSALDAMIDGPTAVASTGGDPAQTVKTCVNFAEKNDLFVLRGGYLEGRVVTKNDLVAISKLPSREVLLAKVLGSMNAPATNLVGVLAALPRQLVTVIDAIGKKKAA
ncbi:MAG: 50S ribosomal protein L10 [Deltaproteobacteria bacterium]|nr:50S ribosomal protein L10 [Deltaproteobacteria bacterium]